MSFSYCKAFFVTFLSNFESALKCVSSHHEFLCFMRFFILSFLFLCTVCTRMYSSFVYACGVFHHMIDNIAFSPQLIQHLPSADWADPQRYIHHQLIHTGIVSISWSTTQHLPWADPQRHFPSAIPQSGIYHQLIHNEIFSFNRWCRASLIQYFWWRCIF